MSLLGVGGDHYRWIVRCCDLREQRSQGKPIVCLLVCVTCVTGCDRVFCTSERCPSLSQLATQGPWTGQQQSPMARLQHLQRTRVRSARELFGYRRSRMVTCVFFRLAVAFLPPPPQYVSNCFALSEKLIMDELTNRPPFFSCPFFGGACTK